MKLLGQTVSVEKAREIYKDIIGRYNVTYSQFLEDRRRGEVKFIDSYEPKSA